LKIVNNMKNYVLFIMIIFLAVSNCRNNPDNTPINNNAASIPQHPINPYYSRTDTMTLNLPDSIWKIVLPDSVYRIARNKETEAAFSGKYWNSTGKGTYYCAACGNALFRSDAWFASTCGWPGFFETMRKNSVKYKSDYSYGMIRTEVLCGRCGAHMGHVFDDGPKPTGQRYCMNSIVLDFVKDK